MKDIKIARFKNPLKVSSVTRLSNNITAIKGEGFLDADEVYINEIHQRSWIILSDKEIAVNFPGGEKVLTVAVLTEKLILNQPNLTFFEIGPSFKSIEGMSKLIQNFIVPLMRTPGTNKFDTFGGGMLKLPGKLMTNAGGNIKADIVNAVERTKNYLINKQNRLNIPLAEKLLDVRVVAVSLDADHNMSVAVTITNKAGESSNVTI
mgnify:FL=1|jgi:hypothetical protein